METADRSILYAGPGWALPAEEYAYTPPLRRRGDLTTAQYLLILALVGIPIGMLMAATWFMGLSWIGLTIGGIAFIALTLWKVEFGLIIVAGLIPWEVQTVLTEAFTMVKAAGIIVAILGLLRVLAGRGPRWPGMVPWAIALGVIATIGMVANMTELTLSVIITLQSNILLMYLFMRFCSKPGALWALFWVAALSSAGEAALGLAHVIAPGHFADPTRLTTAEAINANTYVRLMFPGIFLGILLAARYRSLTLRGVAIAVTVVCLAALVLVVARGATLGVIAGALAILFTMKGLKLGNKLAVAAMVLLLGLGGLWAATSLRAGDIWKERMTGESLGRGASARIGMWSIALRAGLENPVLGIGMGNEPYAYALRGSPTLTSHNDILSCFMQMGFPGLVCFLGFLIAWWRGLWRLPGGMLRSCLIGFFVALVVTGFFNPSYRYKILWMSAGIGAAAVAGESRRRQEEASQQPVDVESYA